MLSMRARRISISLRIASRSATSDSVLATESRRAAARVESAGAGVNGAGSVAAGEVDAAGGCAIDERGLAVDGGRTTAGGRSRPVVPRSWARTGVRRVAPRAALGTGAIPPADTDSRTPVDPAGWVAEDTLLSGAPVVAAGVVPR